jgi:catechol 2,3-dioxygenase-like lactoylglutathione lyase family enzyme
VDQSASRTPQGVQPASALSDEAASPGATGSAPPTGRFAGGIETPDLEKTVTWYRESLGFRELPRYSDKRERLAILERDGALLEVRENKHAAVTGGLAESSPLPMISWEMWVEDVDQEAHRLQERGVSLLTSPRDRLGSGFRGVLVQDIDGRVIALREPLAGH